MQLRGWEKRLRLLRVSSTIIIFTIVALMLLAGFTFYGRQVGNFVINVGDKDINLALSIDPTLTETTSRLAFSGIKDQKDSTYVRIPDNIEEGLGIKNDELKRNYIAYSFYLINLSKVSVDYDMTIDVLDKTGNPLDILRILVLEGENVQKSAAAVYAKAEATEENQTWVDEHAGYKALPFIDDQILVSRTELDLQPNVAVKYTVVIWIEGWDAECDDSHLGDSIKLEMNFNAK